MWHHVSGESNPADIPTRMVTDFKEALMERWFNGPEILLQLSFTSSDNESPITSDKHKKFLKLAASFPKTNLSFFHFRLFLTMTILKLTVY